MISPHNEWYNGNVLVCGHFSSKLAHGTYCLRSITQLFRLLGIVKKNPCYCLTRALVALNNYQMIITASTKAVTQRLI